MKKLLSVLIALVLLVSSVSFADSAIGYSGTLAANGVSVTLDIAPRGNGIYVYLRNDDGSLYLNISDSIVEGYNDAFCTLTNNGEPVSVTDLASLAATYLNANNNAVYGVMTELRKKCASFITLSGAVNNDDYNLATIHLSSADILNVINKVFEIVAGSYPGYTSDLIKLKKAVYKYAFSAALDLMVDDADCGSVTLSGGVLGGALKLEYERDVRVSGYRYTAAISGSVKGQKISGTANYYDGSYARSFDALIYAGSNVISAAAEIGRNQASFTLYAADENGRNIWDYNGMLVVTDDNLAFALNRGAGNIASLNIYNKNGEVCVNGTCGQYLLTGTYADGVLTVYLNRNVTSLFRCELTVNYSAVKGYVMFGKTRMDVDLAAKEFELLEPASTQNLEVSDIVRMCINKYLR